MSGGQICQISVFCTEGRNYEPEIKSRHYWWREQLYPGYWKDLLSVITNCRSANYGWWMSKVVKRNWILFFDLCQRMIDNAGVPMKLYKTLDRREALKDADFVTTQLRVGQLPARELDERIPLSHGYLGQETNGAGGLFKGLRTIPVILTS